MTFRERQHLIALLLLIFFSMLSGVCFSGNGAGIFWGIFLLLSCGTTVQKLIKEYK